MFKNHYLQVLLTIFAIILLALVSSVIVIIKNYSQPKIEAPDIHFQNLADGSINKDFVRAAQKYSSSVAQLYSSYAATKQAVEQSGVFLGNATFISSDGWLVTSTQIISRLSTARIAVTHGDQMYRIVRRVSDDVSGITFLKVEGTNFPVIKFGDFNDAKQGQIDMVLNAKKQATLVQISQKVQKGGNILSEEFPFIYSLQKYPESTFQAGPLLNEDGRMLGIFIQESEKDQLVIPVDAFVGVIGEVFKNSRVARPYLGIEYTEQENGALIERIFSRYNPAGLAGLQKGDIITMVNQHAINSENNLSLVISQQRAGDLLKMRYLRDGEEFEAEVFLNIDE